MGDIIYDYQKFIIFIHLYNDKLSTINVSRITIINFHLIG